MKIKNAFKIRNEVLTNMVNKPFLESDSNFIIRDVVVSSESKLIDVYLKMWDYNMTNEQAIKCFIISEDDFNVFVVSHQWNWGLGDLIFLQLDKYLAQNNL